LRDPSPPSSQLYFLATPPRSERLRLPVHDFIALSPADPLRKINNLAAGQFTTLFHGYTWVVGAALPDFLRLYNQWTIAIHFSLALIGVSAVRDADAVVEDRIRKLKAEAVQEDILTTRRAAINDNPLVLAAARLRGFLDGVSLAVNLLRDKPALSAGDVKQIIDGPQRLFLQSGDDGNAQPGNVTDISGKRWRR
jgi:hypothetical protein